MQEIVVSHTLRTSFRIFPRTTEEFRKWQAEDSMASSFPHNEPRLGYDYCWLKSLEQEISAMNMYAESGDCVFTFPEVATPAEYSGHNESMQKLARMKTVIDHFAIRGFYFKRRAYSDIFGDISGLHSPLRSIIAGAPLLRVHVNTILLNDITLTMSVGRSILLQYYGLTEKLHSHIFRELENRVFILLKYFLAPMHAIVPQDVHHNTYYETYKAGTHFKHLDDLSAMKALQDSYREFFDFDPLGFPESGKKTGRGTSLGHWAQATRTLGGWPRRMRNM